MCTIEMKKLPLAVLITLIIHTAAAVWFAAKLDARVESLEKATRHNQAVIERIIALETSLVNIKDNTHRIERALSQLTDR